MLTAKRLRQVLYYDPNTGLFRWNVSTSNRMKVGSVAGAVSHAHITIGVDARRYFAHRLAWLYMTGEWPSHEIDHRDADGLNNRWANLRAATRTQNARNVPKQKNNTSGFKGAYFHQQSGLWFASITVNRKQMYLGYFKTAKLAHAAYCEAAKTLHGDFARVA